MYCPRCASNQSDEIKFCTVCGANLQAVRQVVDTRETEKKFDWSDTWLADMFLPGAAERRKLELERQLGITPEVKRLNEIKAGVITGSVGIGLSIFLYIFMAGVIKNVTPQAAEILSHVWVAGVIPLFIGLALIINGVVVSKKLVEAIERHEKSLESNSDPKTLKAANTNEFVSSPFSVTEQTTQHLGVPGPKKNRV